MAFFGKRKISVGEIPFIEKIIVYPVKSLDGVEVQSVEITSGGSLSHDRKFAIIDEKGNFVTAKRDSRMHRIRSAYHNNFSGISLSANDKPETDFELRDLKGIGTWFSEFFGFRVSVIPNSDQGFPDDSVSGGPTVVSVSSLVETGRWFENAGIAKMGTGELIKRFRPNILIGGTDPFFEDQFNNKGIFFAGDVTISGGGPCPRCVVPTRHPKTGEVLSGFAKILTENRKENLPEFANREHFKHFYMLCLNTKISGTESGKILKVGDLVRSESDMWGDIF